MKHNRSRLNPAVKRFIKDKEKELDRTCRTIWDFTNPKGNRFLFGSFCKNYNRLIVTIAEYNQNVIGCWLPTLD